MKRKGTQFWCVVVLILVFVIPAKKLEAQNSQENSFKIIGYFFPDSSDTAASVSYKYLTHINYAFAIPNKDASGYLEPILHPETLRDLVKRAHKNNVKVFLSIGGWDLGDGGGNDSRFEKLANHKDTRSRFVQAVIDTLAEYNLDGADIDWEYPDQVEPSSSNFVKLMRELQKALHAQHKKLTAAIVAYKDKNGYGVKNEIFAIADWLNIMAYDDDYNSFGGAVVPHSPYSLGVRSLKYWTARGLTPTKAVLGLPFYGKGKGGGSYKMLLKQGADPYADVKDSIYYNGIKTIQQKTQLAKRQGGGVMIWEIQGDVKGKYSLLNAIYNTVHKVK